MPNVRQITSKFQNSVVTLGTAYFVFILSFMLNPALAQEKDAPKKMSVTIKSRGKRAPSSAASTSAPANNSGNNSANTTASLATTADASPSKELISLAKFRQMQLAELETGARKQVLLKTTKSFESITQATRFQSPWTIEGEIQTDAYNSDSTMARAAPSYLNLAYQDREGWEIRSQNQFYQESSTLEGSQVVPYQGTLTLGRDIIKGGAHSPANISADIRRVDTKAKYFDIETQFLGESLTLESLSVTYFNLLCRIGDFAEPRKSFRNILAAAEIKASAKTLSLTDLLFLKDSANALEARYQDLILRVGDTELQFAAFGPKAQQIAKDLAKTGAQCEDAASVAVNTDSALLAAASEASQETPAVLAARAHTESGKKSVELLKSEKRMSLIPYAGMAELQDGPASYTRTEGIVGIRFNYNFAGRDKALEIKGATEQVQSYQEQEHQTAMDESRDIASLIRQVERGAKYMPFLKKSMDDSKKLLDVIRVQLELGLIDPTITGQAYLSHMDAVLTARDTWERSLIAESQLRQYVEARTRVGAELKSGLHEPVK